VIAKIDIIFTPISKIEVKYVSFGYDYTTDH